MIGIKAFLYREWIQFSQSKLNIGMSLIFPIITLVVFASNMAGVAGDINGIPYTHFILPGVAVMAVMNSSSQASSRTFNERYSHILPELLSFPASKPAYIFSKIFATTVIAGTQGCIFFLLGLSLFQIPISPLGILYSLIGLGITAWGLVSLFLCFALVIKNMQVFLTITNLFGQILIWTSTIFYPSETMPKVLAWLSYINPMTHGIEILRGYIYGSNEWANWIFIIAFSFLLGFITIPLLSRRNKQLY
jgi:ABC-2 type transport system permease protein